MFGNQRLSPELLMALGGGIMSGQNLGQGLGQGFQQASNIMAVQKQEREIKEGENKTRAFVQKMFPDQDFSQAPPEVLKLYATEAIKSKFAKPDLPATAQEYNFAKQQGYTGSFMDYQKYKANLDGGSSLPADYQNFQLAQQNPAYADYLSKNNRTGQTFEERKKIAEDLGIKPGDERYEPYVATGKFPREDQQRMTAGDKAQLYELQDKIDANKAVISNLKSIITPAKEGEATLNDRAGSGWTASAQAFGARNDPTGGWLFDQEQGQATTELQTIVTENSLGQLRAIFGGNPTEGERNVLRELEASIDKSPKEREAVIKRAIVLAERRLQNAEERAASIRDESFYQPSNTTRQSTTSGRTKTGIGFTVEGP